MTLSNVKVGSTELALLAIDDSSIHSPLSPAAAAAPTTVSQTMRDALAAANEDEAATPDAIRNPLWIIAWAMACLFGVMAAVIALG
jgi:hypothetical protein